MSSLSDKLSGNAKQVAGKATDDKGFQAEGKLQEAKGGITEKLKEASDKISDKLNDVKR